MRSGPIHSLAQDPRLATGAGAAPAFIVVVTITLLVLFAGWRGVAGLIARVVAR